mmetsp:Transcript_13274/g.21656  ORF Transcript_13274/g.21656 Transcript_13274/m.21656 type:complete len:421 (-) Transcript_13274:1592-2854(-)
MGAYLDKPRTEKYSEDTLAGNGVHFAVSEMQGWRKTMEDAYIVNTDIMGDEDGDKDIGIYAVFDGHGGGEVSKFCSRHFVEEIKKLEDFQRSDYAGALQRAFHVMDDMLRKDTYGPEIAALRLQKDHHRALGSLGVSDDGAAGGSGNGSVTAKESMQAEVKQKMEAAEEKGSLTKSEALELVMQMMRLTKMEEEQSQDGAITGKNGGPSLTDPIRHTNTGANRATGAKFTDAGCTAIVALTKGNSLYVANAGDSRGVMCRKGLSVALSTDHKPTNETELTRIQQAGGYVNEVGRVNGNLNLSRSIGDLKYKVDSKLPPEKQIITAQPDVEIFTLTPEDEYFVLACDGVFDVLSNEQLVHFINERLWKGVRPVSKIVEDIFDECICDNPNLAQGIGADNMTCMIILLKPLEYFAPGEQENP